MNRNCIFGLSEQNMMVFALSVFFDLQYDGLQYLVSGILITHSTGKANVSTTGVY